MLCPKCKRNGKDVKMKCVDSRRIGSFQQDRYYDCPKCKERVYTVEKMR